MGWVYKADKPHKCKRPWLSFLGIPLSRVGSIWECDECGQQWKVKEWCGRYWDRTVYPY